MKSLVVVVLALALSGCAVASVTHQKASAVTFGQVEVNAYADDPDAGGKLALSVKGGPLSSVGAGVISSAITAAVMYFTGGAVH